MIIKKSWKDRLSKKAVQAALLFFGATFIFSFAAPSASALTVGPNQRITTVAAATADDTLAKCQASGFDLSWIICSVINGLAETSDFLIDNFITPFLRVTPLSINNPQDSIYKAWTSFRVLANIILVIAIIVIVFGQAIGGGLVDAYTAKKSLPRLFVAAILINVSYYIVAGLVDVTNIIGQGIGQLITAPFDVSDNLSIKPNFGADALGFIGVVGGIFAALAGGGAFLGFLFVFVLVPALVAMIGVFVTLIIRQGIILFLVIISPVAFALYALPNTEQYFKKWWGLLTKTLMVYPIVVVVISVANILAVTVSKANETSGPRAAIAALAGMVIMIIPLFLIPFAFKLAGGVVANIASFAAGVGKQGQGFMKGNINDPNSLQNKTKRNLANQATWKRGGAYDAFNNFGSRGVKFDKNGNAKNLGKTSRLLRRGVGAAGSRAVGGYDLEDKMSRLRAERAEIANKRIATGDDTAERAFLTDKSLFKAGQKGVDALKQAGYSEGVHYKIDPKNGAIKLRNDQGKFHTLAQVGSAYSMYDKDQPGQQKSISYGYQKALLQAENDELLNSMPRLQQDWGISVSDMNGQMIGAGFEQANKSKQYKRYSLESENVDAKDANGNIIIDPATNQPKKTTVTKLALDGSGFVDEMHAGVGTYAGLQQDADTWTTMTATYEAAQREAATNPAAAASIMKMNEIANQYAGMDTSQLAAEIQRQQPDMTQGASAAAAANIKEFVTMAKTGLRTSGGSITTRSRKEKINFKPPTTPLQPPTSP